MTVNGLELRELALRGYRFAHSLTHDASKAEDILQDAWHAVIRARGPFNRGYLFAAIRTRFIDYCRKQNGATLEPLPDDLVEVVEDSIPPIESEERFELSGGLLNKALAELKPQERSVLYLSVVEGYTAQGIADLLEWPRGTVLSSLHRTRGKLKQLLNVEAKSTL